MNTAILSPASRPLLNGIPPQLNMVMIYEDGKAGRRAKQFSDQFLHEVGGHCRCVRNLWSFDALSITRIRNAAAGTAQNANLVILSVSGEHALSPSVERWLDLWIWLIDEANPALVLLFENSNGRHAGAIRDSLRALAKQKPIAFFPQPTSEPSADLVRVERETLAGSSRSYFHHAVADGAPTKAVQPGEKSAGRIAGRSWRLS